MRKISEIVKDELARQDEVINLIASECPLPVICEEYLGSRLHQKYAEGYPGKRYYNGCKIIDELEEAAITNVAEVFRVKFANVQPHSGTAANHAVWKAAEKWLASQGLSDIEPVSTLSMKLSAGGHLSHFSKPSFEERGLAAVYARSFYGVDEKGEFDWKAIREWLHTHKFGIIVIGCSSYPLRVNYGRFADMIKSAKGTYVIVHDISHIAGFVASGVFSHPLSFDWGSNAVVMTSTTHKTWGGPRHAVILWDDDRMTKYINHAVFPEIQGGANFAIIAAVGAWAETIRFNMGTYVQMQKDIIKNTGILTEPLKDHLVFGGTENHLALVRCSSKKHAEAVADKLEESKIIVNTNQLYDGSWGLRISASHDTMKFGKARPWKQIGEYIKYVIENTTVEG